MASNGERFGPFQGSRGKVYRVTRTDEEEGHTWDVMFHGKNGENPEGVSVEQQIKTRKEARRICRELNEQHEREES